MALLQFHNQISAVPKSFRPHAIKTLSDRWSCKD